MFNLDNDTQNIPSNALTVWEADREIPQDFEILDEIGVLDGKTGFSSNE